jgi:membrane-bound metal-dependent hydrolase YbcI (DUF457 family)
MPSPIGHALAGAATVFATDAATRRRSSDRIVLAAAALAALPDIDLLDYRHHRTVTHSVTAVAAVFIITAALTGKVTRWRTAAIFALAWASHLVLDWLAQDHFPPFGIQAFWPFSRRWFISGLGLFRETARLHLFSRATILFNLRTGLQEIAILLPIVAALWLVRVKAAPRFATEVSRRHHPPQ